MKKYGMIITALFGMTLQHVYARDVQKVYGHYDPHHTIGNSEEVTIADPKGNAFFKDEDFLFGARGCLLGGPNDIRKNVMWASAKRGERGMIGLKNISNTIVTLRNANPHKGKKETIEPGQTIVLRFGSGDNLIAADAQTGEAWTPIDDLSKYLQVTFCRVDYWIWQPGYDTLELNN